MVIFTIIISMVVLQTSESQKANIVAKYVLAWVGIPTFFLAFTVFLSYKSIKCAELIGMSIIVPSVIVMFISYMTDEIFVMDNRERNVQALLYCVWQIILTHFMSIDFIPHLIQRQVFWLICNGIVMINPKDKGESNMSPAFIITLGLLFVLSNEAILYFNHKAKAKLFMQIKVMA